MLKVENRFPWALNAFRFIIIFVIFLNRRCPFFVYCQPIASNDDNWYCLWRYNAIHGPFIGNKTVCIAINRHPYNTYTSYWYLLSYVERFAIGWSAFNDCVSFWSLLCVELAIVQKSMSNKTFYVLLTVHLETSIMLLAAFVVVFVPFFVHFFFFFAIDFVARNRFWTLLNYIVGCRLNRLIGNSVKRNSWSLLIANSNNGTDDRMTQQKRVSSRDEHNLLVFVLIIFVAAVVTIKWPLKIFRGLDYHYYRLHELRSMDTVKVFHNWFRIFNGQLMQWWIGSRATSVFHSSGSSIDIS